MVERGQVAVAEYTPCCMLQNFLKTNFMGQLNVTLENLLYACYGKPLQQW